MNDEKSKSPSERWILSFDASCGTCRTISALVARETTDLLEVLPLTHTDVHGWRETAFGSEAPFVPTLTRVRESGVKAWTGPRLSVRLIRRLGLPKTVRLLRALGELKRASGQLPSEDGRSLSRAGFVKLGAGVGVAAGMVLAGRTPAIAATSNEVETWLKAHQDRLPERYEEVIKYPINYRRAIFSELRPDAKRQLWTAHIDNYRSTHTNLTAAQSDAIDQAERLLRQLYRSGRTDASVLATEGERVEAAVKDAFGLDEARTLVAMLGPDAIAMECPRACDCSTVSDYCWDSCVYNACNCRRWTGCGLFWSYECNGACSACEC